jgi:hypothetical protein
LVRKGELIWINMRGMGNKIVTVKVLTCSLILVNITDMASKEWGRLPGTPGTWLERYIALTSKR